PVEVASFVLTHSITMSRPSIILLFFVSTLLLDRVSSVPTNSRDRVALQAEMLEDLLEKVAEEIQVRAIEREIIERNLDTDEISSSPSKRDSNEKRNLSRLAQMGARGFGRRRR
ncbi:hypothetical protein PMAYCL1PPCAC_30186, partial [Pristionchus mayeri]